jgi:hypothetical protein
MDVRDRIAAGLPHSAEELEADGPRDVVELWLLARAYSRLRHRTCPRRHPREHQRLTLLKAHCVRLAVTREPGRFLVFPDPGRPHLWLVYHLLEKNLLHLPVTTDLGKRRPVREDSSSRHETAGGNGAVSLASQIPHRRCLDSGDVRS